MTTYEFRYADPDAPDGERCLLLDGTNLQRDIQGGMSVIVTPDGQIRAAAPTDDVIDFSEVDEPSDDCESPVGETTDFEWRDVRHLSDDS